MRRLALLVVLCIIAIPATAMADDLTVSFYYSPDEVGHSVTFHDAETGVVPTLTVDVNEDHGLSLAIELEFYEDGSILMVFMLSEVLWKVRRGDLPRAVRKSRVIGTPSVQVLPGDGAFIKQGNAKDGSYLSVEAVYTPTDG